jgi:hypothetical protein
MAGVALLLTWLSGLLAGLPMGLAAAQWLRVFRPLASAFGGFWVAFANAPCHRRAFKK